MIGRREFGLAAATSLGLLLDGGLPAEGAVLRALQERGAHGASSDEALCNLFPVDQNVLAAVTRQLSDAGARSASSLNTAILKCLASQDGVVALAWLLAHAPERAIRSAIARQFGEFGLLFSVVSMGRSNPMLTRLPDAPSLALLISAAFDAATLATVDPLELREMSENQVKFHARRAAPIMLAALDRISKGKDGANADALRLAFLNYFLRGMLPTFFYRRFPVLEGPRPLTNRLRVLTFGDFGTGNAAQRSVAAAIEQAHADKPFDMGITLGDNFYERGLDDPESRRWQTDWEALYGPLGIPFYQILGNHDYSTFGSPLAEIAYSEVSKNWHLPSPNYSVRSELVEFFALDTNVVLEDQLAWLRSSLLACKARWKIVYGHNPIFSSGVIADSEPIDLVSRLLPVLTECKADIYLSGHNHAMEEYSPQGGVRMFTIGSGGASIYNFDKAPDSVFRANQHGFGILEISSENVTIELVDVDRRVLHRASL